MSGLEQRVTKLEVDAGQVRNDLSRIAKRQMELAQQQVQHGTATTILQKSMQEGFEQMDQRFTYLVERFDTVDQRFDAVDQRFDAMDQRFDAVDKVLSDLTAAVNDLKKPGSADTQE